MTNRRIKNKVIKRASNNTIDFIESTNDSKLKYILPSSSHYRKLDQRDRNIIDKLVLTLQHGSDMQKAKALRHYMHNINSVTKNYDYKPTAGREKLVSNFEYTEKIYNLKKIIDDRMPMFTPGKYEDKYANVYEKQQYEFNKKINDLKDKIKYTKGDISEYEEDLEDIKQRKAKFERKWNEIDFSYMFQQAYDSLPENQQKVYHDTENDSDVTIDTLGTSYDYMRDQMRNYDAYEKEDGFIVVVDLDEKATSGKGRGRFVWGDYADLDNTIKDLNSIMQRSGPTEQWGTKTATDIF